MSGAIFRRLSFEKLVGILMESIDDVTRWYRWVLDYVELGELGSMPFGLRLEKLPDTSAHTPKCILYTKTYQCRALLMLSILAMILPVVVHTRPALIRRRLREAILGFGMGPLLPHLMSSVSRRESLQGPSERKL
jgi:hypothetical protein